MEKLEGGKPFELHSWLHLQPPRPPPGLPLSINHLPSCPRKNLEVLHDTSLFLTPTCNLSISLVGSTPKVCLKSRLPRHPPNWSLYYHWSAFLRSIGYTNARLITHTHTHTLGTGLCPPQIHVKSLTPNVTIFRIRK